MWFGVFVVPSPLQITNGAKISGDTIVVKTTSGSPTHAVADDGLICTVGLNSSE
jgi:hypothetical protein